jgi:glycosyltransferase involved in cell wall biosynthesis
MFRELLVYARQEFPQVEWDLFAPRGYEAIQVDGVCTQLVNVDSGNLAARLAADHFYVPEAARRRGCRALITVGFLPRICPLPAAVHVLTLHHLDKTNQTGRLRSEYRRREINRVLAKAELVITNSCVAANELMTLQPSVTNRLLVSHEGIDHEVFHPVAPTDEVERLKEGLSLSPNYILWVSNFYPYKQLNLLLEAYAGLTETEREAHPLVLVGGDWQGSRSRTEELAASLGISRNLRFPGWVAEEWIAPLYRHAAIHVLASRSETFGRSVLEAMACGAPCVVNDIPIMREVTAGNAIFTDFTDREASTAALRQALIETAMIAELRRNGIERARHFSMRKLARERVAAVLERLSWR